MGEASVSMAVILTLGLMLVTYSGRVGAVLSATYYQTTCPNLTNIVRAALLVVQDNDPVNMPAIVRLFAHDCLTDGCDASVLLDTVSGFPPSEQDSTINKDLFGFQALDFVKFEIEDQCPEVVSCADILALSAQICIEMVGGPVYSTLLGRRDSRVSLASDSNAQLPVQNMTMDQLIANFASVGLSLHDLVILTGAHTIGFAHCSSFLNRIYNFNATFNTDPSMDLTFADELRKICPKNPNSFTVNALDVATPNVFDNGFYQNLQIQEGILASDQVLYVDPRSSDLVDMYAGDLNSFFGNFTIAMIKMGNIGVLQAPNGEIRSDCSSRN